MFCSCVNNTETMEEDTFYSECGGWSMVRLPLIKPYEVLSIDPETTDNIWSIKFDSDELFSTDHVQRITVEDSIIYVLSGIFNGEGDSTALVGSMYPTVWYIINTKNGDKRGFHDIEVFNNYLLLNRYPHPHWYDIDSLFIEYCQNNKKLPWSPE